MEKTSSELAAWIGEGKLARVEEEGGIVLYRAWRPDGSPAGLVKAPAADGPSPRSIALLRHEHEILSALDLSGVVKTKALTQVGSSLALVLEWDGAETLAERMALGPVELGEVLEIAVQLADVLAGLQARHLAHLSLTPSRILWAPERRRLTLLGFGHARPFASLSPVQGMSADFAEPQGSCLYLSPEQTGRTERPVDHRTDHYAFGAILYEMLSGRPPFVSKDRLELIHAHLARQPTLLTEIHPTVPRLISDVAQKLLAKAPEERYQSARALADDLRRAAKELTETGRVATFPLGGQDTPSVLQIPEKLYGRAKELAALPEALARVAAGRRELVLVTGAPGIGKTALVNNLAAEIARRGGFLASGKFDQLGRGTPYSALAEALRFLVRQLVAMPEETLAPWRERIRTSLAPNGQLLEQLVPELTLVIGAQPPVEPVGPVESKNRFRLVFLAFLRALASAESPLVLFLDDLQWVDASSLDLLERLVEDRDCRHILVLGALRDGEVGPSHPLALALAELRNSGAPVREIRLGSLAEEDVAALLSDTLGRGREDVLPLAKLLARKTAGNAFFLRQVLRSLYAEGFIRFREASGRWEWDLLACERASIAENVVELMVKAIDGLPPATREALRTTAALGKGAEIDTLSAVSGRTRAETLKDVWPALDRGFLVPSGQAGPWKNGAPDAVHFVHDRVQQAAYSGVLDGQRETLHLRIGRLLLKTIPSEELEKRVFDVADQLNRSEALVEDPAERLTVARLNLRAGRKAKASAAYDAALGYFSHGATFLGPDPWDADAELAFSLFAERAESAYLTGRRNEAERLIGEALVHAPSATAKAELYCLRTVAATVAGDYAAALGWGREGLALFGQAWPLDGLPAATEAEAAAIMKNLAGRRIESLGAEPEAGDEGMRACIRLLSILGPPAYFSDSDVLEFILTKITNLSLLHGPSPYSAYGYTFYGALHNRRTGDYETGHAFGKLALDLAQRFGNRMETSRTLEVFGLLVNPWKVPLRANVPLFKEAYLAGIESGELQYAAYNLQALLINGLPLGVPLEELEADVKASLEFSTKHENKTIIEFSLPFRQVVRCLTGRTPGPDSFDDAEFTEADFLREAKDNRTAVAFYWAIRQQAAYLLGDFETADRCGRTAGEMIGSAMGMIIEAEHVFYTALTRAALFERAPESKKSALRAEIVGLRARLATWAEHCPENFRHKELLVGAEIARTHGPSEAAGLYDEAVAAARAEGFVQDEALANELAARYYAEQDRRRVAGLYLRAAREGYVRWGARAKVDALERSHGDLLAPERESAAPAGPVPLDTLALVKASQAISAETVPARLFNRILRVAVELAGAERGALVLSEDGELRERARITAADEKSEPSGERRDLPRAILRYAARTLEPLVLHDACAGGPFASDPEVRSLGIRSALCVPLLKQSTLIGLLYLENNATSRAFRAERVELLRHLGAQASISLENSFLNATLEQRVRERTAELEEAVRKLESISVRENFLNMASHELKTPLTSLLLQVQGVLRDLRAGNGTGRERTLVMAESAVQQGHRLTKLVNDLLEVSQAMAGKLRLTPADADLGTLLRGVANQFRSHVDAEGGGIEVRGPESVPGRWDAFRLEQVVANLISNAVKYGNGKPIRISLEAHEETVAFAVRDWGIGIAPEFHKRMFTPFERGVPPTHSPGFGLGLFIAREIVVGHGGTISVKSDPGWGSTFAVTLPRRVGAGQDSESSSDKREGV